MMTTNAEEPKTNVKTVTNYNCGCGFKTTKLVEARAHVESTDHSLHILGEVRSLKPTIR